MTPLTCPFLGDYRDLDGIWDCRHPKSKDGCCLLVTPSAWAECELLYSESVKQPGKKIGTIVIEDTKCELDTQTPDLAPVISLLKKAYPVEFQPGTLMVVLQMCDYKEILTRLENEPSTNNKAKD